MIDMLLAEIIQREGVKDTNNPNDAGGRTKYGISEKWHPEAWTNGPPTLEAAKQIFFNSYVVQPGIVKIKPEFLRDQVADFGVLSGPATAIQHLQGLLKVPADGTIGQMTLDAIAKRNPDQLNNQLVDDRVLMLARLTQKRPSDIEFLFGWLTRALSFRR